MALNLGTSEIFDIKLGTTQIHTVMLGTTLVWAYEKVVTLTSRGDSPIIKNFFTAADWGNPNVIKRVIIASGAHIGANYLGHALATSDSASGQAGSWAGQLIIENHGTISGIGGAANSGTGGTALLVTYLGRNGEKASIINYGTIRGGGGGGGRGGTGGGGYYNYNYREPSSGWYFKYDESYTNRVWGRRSGDSLMYWDSGPNYAAWNDDQNATSHTQGGWTYLRGPQVDGAGEIGGRRFARYQIARQQTRQQNTNGGAGGNGGRGQGYDGGRASGSAGAGGGTNAGTGGTGGTGGLYGAAGGTGATGNSGNRTGGSAGASGGAAGLYLNGTGKANLTNHGTVQGRTQA